MSQPNSVSIEIHPANNIRDITPINNQSTTTAGNLMQPHLQQPADDYSIWIVLFIILLTVVWIIRKLIRRGGKYR